MRTSVFHPGALGLALLSGPALAAGFGEINLLSRIGEPLRAEVNIVSSGRESIETACFSLAPMREADMPVVSSARLQLIKDGHNYRLLIAGKPIADPVFMIALRAGCGIELQRDFVLMPQAPIAPVVAQPMQASTSASDTAAAVPGRKWRASEGETLEGLAENLAPGDTSRQRRMLAALRRANPGVESSMPLAEGTEIRIPDLRKQSVSETRNRSDSRVAQRPNRSNTAQAEGAVPEARPQPAPAKPKAAEKTQDRLVLSAAPDDLRPGEKASSKRAPLPEMEERMARMEATLNLLNEEISKLNQALALTTEALEVQQKLQTAQSTAVQQTKVVEKQPTPLAAAAPTFAPHPSTDNWIELLLSAVAGGIISALAAHILVLRRKNRLNDELPLAVQASRLHSAAESIAPPPTPTPAPRPVVEEPAAPPADPKQELANFEVTESDSYSLMKLAEIMLSFGRIHDAAETLAQYIKEASPNQIQPWTMLLDLYRRGNMPTEFEVLASRIRERFNVRVPTWEEAKAPDSELHTLEGYPHVVAFLQEAWGRQECMDFLQDLVTDNRSGKRSGFPLEVVEEIVLLMRVLEDSYGLKRA